MPLTRRLSALLPDALVLLIAAACLFWGLGVGPFRDNNEALYADIGLRMARGGSWLIPHLDGVAYIEKPPLLYWLMALSFKIFGFGTWQARLPDALAAWLSVGALLVWGHAVRAPLAGRFAALVTGTALGFVLIARTILFDPLMLLWWLLAFGCIVLAAQRASRAWLRLAMLPLALAVLTKGPEALALLGLIGLLQLLLSPGPQSRAALLRLYLDPWAIGLFLLLVLPWPLAAGRAQPGFAWFFWINETVMRFVGRRVPDDFHTGPWWYYGPRLLIGFLQWTPVLIALALRTDRLRVAGDAAASALWARNAALVLSVFFSLASNKGAYYLLPVVPLLAWWTGMRVQQAADQGRLARLLPAAAAGCALLGAAALGLWAATFTGPVRDALLRSGMPPGSFAWVPALIGTVALLGLLGAALLRRGRAQAGLAVFALSALPMVGFATALNEAKTPDISQRQTAAALRAALPPGSPVYSWRQFEDRSASLLVYGIPRLLVVDSLSADLWFGCAHAGPRSPCVDRAALRRALDAGGPVAVWVARDRLPEFEATGLGAGLRTLEFKDSVVFLRTGP